MRISTKGKYALEAIVDLAIESSSEFESLKNIAERRNISENYLEQIFMRLRKNNIVESTRGAHGGYRLTKDPKEITVEDVILAVEGDISPVDCVSKNKGKQHCERYEECVTRILWQDIMSEINGIIANKSIADLIKSYRELNYVDQIEYYI